MLLMEFAYDVLQFRLYSKALICACFGLIVLGARILEEPQLGFDEWRFRFWWHTVCLSQCVQQVQNYDCHHYLCLLELPPNMRKAAFALRAFNIETARRAMDVASDPKIETVEELERYAEDTVSTLLYMTLQAGGIKSTAADHAASHIGKASGLLLLLKSLPYHANCNLFEIASVANSHLQKARELAGTVPNDACPVLLPAVPSQVLLDSLSRAQFDVFDLRLTRGILGIPPLWYQLKLKWHSWCGKY
ncbi:terpenoid synthases superfamily protein [Actinidia rufa]|uniref:Terpenoid synthases superfamily protein n=1 Tax=Actinidia rufa TaxID=165716 RepID=A0A7J0FTB4_9ERIC|nr:terpenoid synthases superfamily protein [Actinidia rufa]